MTDPHPRRVRVTAPRAGEPLQVSLPAEAPADAEGVVVAGLIRSQLRLALLCAFGFVVTLAAIGAVAAQPALDTVVVAGVPASWLVLAFGAYPPLVAIAAIAVLAAGRTEAQFQALSRPAEAERPVP